MDWRIITAVTAAGGAGALGRFALARAVQRYAGIGFPWGTLAVNAAGCLLFGMAWAVAEERALASPALRAAVLVGFLGAFTTFSTFAFETVQLLRDAAWTAAAVNVAAQNALGFAFVLAGMRLGRVF